MSNNVKLDKRIYLDYAAQTPIDPDVLKKMVPYFGAPYGNPSSLCTSGIKANNVLSQTRKKVAGFLHVQPDEIIFTGSGTESDNLAILGVARANKQYGNHIIVSAIEHKAVLESAKQLEREGFEITFLPVDSLGMINVVECVKKIKKSTILISVMYANNEIGTIQPIAELARSIKKFRGEHSFPLFHTDACQAAGFLDLDVSKLGVDLMTLNGSKIYGPKGVGVLFVKKEIQIQPILFGGGQEKKLRSGTENLPAIVGFGEALAIVEKKKKSESKRLIIVRDYFIKNLLKKIPWAIVNGHATKRLPNNVHISIPSIEGEAMLLTFDSFGVEVSTGSACSASDLQPSHVLVAIGQDPDIIHGSLRFSFGRDTTKKKLDYVLSIFPSVVKNLMEMSALTTMYEQEK